MTGMTGSGGTNYGGNLPAWRPGDVIRHQRLNAMQDAVNNLQGPSGQRRQIVLCEALEQFTSDGFVESGNANQVLLVSDDPTTYSASSDVMRVTDTFLSNISEGTRFYATFNTQSGRWETLVSLEEARDNKTVGGGCTSCTCCEEDITEPDQINVAAGISECCPGIHERIGRVLNQDDGTWVSEPDPNTPCSGTDPTNPQWTLDTNVSPASLSYNTGIGDVTYEFAGPGEYDPACSGQFNLSSAPCRVAPCVCVLPQCAPEQVQTVPWEGCIDWPGDCDFIPAALKFTISASGLVDPDPCCPGAWVGTYTLPFRYQAAGTGLQCQAIYGHSHALDGLCPTTCGPNPPAINPYYTCWTGSVTRAQSGLWYVSISPSWQPPFHYASQPVDAAQFSCLGAWTLQRAGTADSCSETLADTTVVSAG